MAVRWLSRAADSTSYQMLVSARPELPCTAWRLGVELPSVVCQTRQTVRRSRASTVRLARVGPAAGAQELRLLGAGRHCAKDGCLRAFPGRSSASRAFVLSHDESARRLLTGRRGDTLVSSGRGSLRTNRRGHLFSATAFESHVVASALVIAGAHPAIQFPQLAGLALATLRTASLQRSGLQERAGAEAHFFANPSLFPA